MKQGENHLALISFRMWQKLTKPNISDIQIKKKQKQKNKNQNNTEKTPPTCRVECIWVSVLFFLAQFKDKTSITYTFMDIWLQGILYTQS